MMQKVVTPYSCLSFIDRSQGSLSILKTGLHQRPFIKMFTKLQKGLLTATAQAAAVTATQASVATATVRAQAMADYLALLAQGQAATATTQTAGVTASAQSAAAERETLALAREQRIQPLKTFGTWVIGLALVTVLLGLGSWGIVTAIRVWDARQRVVATGPFGKPLVLLAGPKGSAPLSTRVVSSRQRCR